MILWFWLLFYLKSIVAERTVHNTLLLIFVLSNNDCCRGVIDRVCGREPYDRQASAPARRHVRGQPLRGAAQGRRETLLRRRGTPQRDRSRGSVHHAQLSCKAPGWQNREYHFLLCQKLDNSLINRKFDFEQSIWVISLTESQLKTENSYLRIYFYFYGHYKVRVCWQGCNDFKNPNVSCQLTSL